MTVIIATTTWSPVMDIRALLALKTLEEASSRSHQIVVVDGGSCGDFLKSCLDIGPMVKIFDQEEKGMGPSRRQAMREASKIAAGANDTVFWMEPEKHTMVKEITFLEHWMRRHYSMTETDPADIVVPTRTSLESYPPIQRVAETLGNMYFAKITGHELDMWVGPRLIGPRAMPYFLGYKGEYGDKWDSIFVPVMRAIKDGLKVIGCDVDYVHPVEQTAAEEADPGMDMKRFVQLQNLVPTFYAEARKLGLKAA